MNVLLKDRAHLFQQVRAFFSARSVLEVDCPALSPAAPIDLHIDVMPVSLSDGSIGYLHTSPEYGMKRLLAASIGDIYQMSHVFRNGEIGPLHNPEFTMIEWYRLSFSFQAMIKETLELIFLFLLKQPVRFISYREALLQYAGIDYVHATLQDLRQIDLSADSRTWDRDTLLTLIVATLVEPHLGKDQLDVLFHFPASQAALAKTSIFEGEPIAHRFEVYSQGIELANGYEELTDPIEQRHRFEKTLAARQVAGKPPLPIDNRFLAALEQGLPDCCGVAVGFDRLMLLRHRLNRLSEMLPFHWLNA